MLDLDLDTVVTNEQNKMVHKQNVWISVHSLSLESRPGTLTSDSGMRFLTQASNPTLTYPTNS